MADSPAPLCTYAQFTEGPFADLVNDYDESVVTDFLIEATRLTEEAAGGRRLAPFTLTETHRASANDPDEYADSANLPMNIQGTLGWSYAMALGTTNLVRHVWVHEFPARYQDLWAYSDVSVTAILSYGGTPQVLGPGQILDGPDDTGHIWFSVGQFIPIGTRLRVTYSGGYVTSIPASLVRASKYLTAELVIRELNPGTTQHDPDVLREDAMKILENWGRD